MTTNEPLSTVHRMFAAFRAGDVDGILETVHSDSRWTYIGANPKPTKREFVGHANVRRFFEGILKRLDMTAFDAIEFVVQDNTVVVFGGESGTIRSTGAAFRNEWVQKYVVEENRTAEMAEYNMRGAPIEAHLGITHHATAFKRREIEIIEPNGSLQFVRALAGEEDDGAVCVDPVDGRRAVR
jgi:ketosteroid isomerase-like protein